MLTVIVVKPQHTPKPRIQWMLASLKNVPIIAYEQENDANILIICPLLELSISNFFICLLCRMDKRACNFMCCACVVCAVALRGLRRWGLPFRTKFHLFQNSRYCIRSAKTPTSHNRKQSSSQHVN